MKLFKTAVNNAKTHDIIYSLCIAAPAAIKQAKQFNLPEIIGLTGGNLQNDATLTGKWIKNNVKYKIDSFENQNIQLPSAILKSKLADCKSISLLYLAIMEAAGYNGGFRFAGYRGKNFTHVYNFFENKNKLFTFDACISDLKEHNTYTKIKDMKVNYLAGTPMLIDETGINRQPTAIELMQDDRVLSINGIGRKKKGKGLDKFKNFINKAGNLTKTVALAPARGSFLLLVNLNFRALTKRLIKLRNKNENQFAEWWTKLGGDIDKLNKAIEKGSTKKPLFGAKKGVNGLGADYEYMGEPVTAATVTAALTSAAGIIAALNKLLKKESIPEEPGEEPLGEGLDPEAPLAPELEPGEPVIPNDPASSGAASYIEKGINFLKGVTGNKPAVRVKPRTSRPAGSGSGLQAGNLTNQEETTGFKPSPLLIGGGIAAIAAIYLLTKKKKK
jgi:hypothetical protein